MLCDGTNTYKIKYYLKILKHDDFGYIPTSYALFKHLRNMYTVDHSEKHE